VNHRRWALSVALLALGCGSRMVGTLGDGQSPSGGGAGMSQASAGQSGLGATSPSSVGGGGSNAGGVAGTAGTVGGGNGGGSGGSEAEPMGGVGGQAGMGGNGPTDDGGAAGEGGAADLPPLTAVPVVRFKLEECGNESLDTSGTVHGQRYAITCGDGIDGKAASFSAEPSDDINRRIEIPDEPKLQFTHELTVAAWVFPQGVYYQGAIVSKWYLRDSFMLAVRQITTKEGGLSPRFTFSICEPEGEWGRPSEVISPDEVTLGEWAHVAGVYRWSPDGHVGQITLYVNGKPVATNSTKIGTDGLQQGERSLNIGWVDQGHWFIGQIDEVRLYDVALGPELGWLVREPAHP